MKMPSTYISLLLLCGFMYVFYFAHRHTHVTSPPMTRPVVTEMRPVVKRILRDKPPVFSLDKNYSHEKDTRQTRLNKTGFSFFRDVIGHIAPLLKNIR
jgi:hypothetical protein